MDLGSTVKILINIEEANLALNGVENKELLEDSSMPNRLLIVLKDGASFIAIMLLSVGTYIYLPQQFPVAKNLKFWIFFGEFWLAFIAIFLFVSNIYRNKKINHLISEHDKLINETLFNIKKMACISENVDDLCGFVHLVEKLIADEKKIGKQKGLVQVCTYSLHMDLGELNPIVIENIKNGAIYEYILPDVNDMHIAFKKLLNEVSENLGEDAANERLKAFYVPEVLVVNGITIHHPKQKGLNMKGYLNIPCSEFKHRYCIIMDGEAIARAYENIEKIKFSANAFR